MKKPNKITADIIGSGEIGFKVHSPTNKKKIYEDTEY